MIKPIKSIMLATNLSENCIHAFEMAASMAAAHQATLIFLHVLEHIPGYIDSRLRGLLGNEEYERLEKEKNESARQALIGKKSSNTIIHDALAQFCASAGIDDNECTYQSREIVVSDGDLIEEIISKSREYNCDLIVMGARAGFISDNSIGHTIKAVMRQSGIPVMMVPPAKK